MNTSAGETPTPPLGTGPDTAPVFMIGASTNTGRSRDHNEDRYSLPGEEADDGQSRLGSLFVVADGMGGYAAGEVAASIAVASARAAFYATEGQDLAAALTQAAAAAQNDIVAAQEQSPGQAEMGCTLAIAAIRGHELCVAHVGDSRIYRLRQGVLAQLTEDHSWVAEQIREGNLTTQAAHSHAYRSMLNRALGHSRAPSHPDISAYDWLPGDRLLICTDGLWSALTPGQIKAGLMTADPVDAADQLVNQANQLDGSDNITGIVVAALESPSGRLPGARQPLAAATRGPRRLAWAALAVLAVVMVAVAAITRGTTPAEVAPGAVAARATVTPPATDKGELAVGAPVSAAVAAASETPEPSMTPMVAVTDTPQPEAAAANPQPTETLAPTAVNAVNAVPAATAGQTTGSTAARGAIELCTRVIRDKCRDGLESVPAASRSVYAAFPEMEEGASIEAVWFKDNSLVHTDQCIVRRRFCTDRKIAPMWALLTAGDVTGSARRLPAGSYRFELHQNGVIVLSRAFEVR